MDPISAINENQDLIYDVSRYTGGNLTSYAKSLGYKNWNELSAANNNIKDTSVKSGQVFRYNFRPRQNGEITPGEQWLTNIKNTQIDANDLYGTALKNAILNDPNAYETMLFYNADLDNRDFSALKNPYNIRGKYVNNYNKALFDAIDKVGRELNLNDRQIAAVKGNAYVESAGGSTLVKGVYEGPFHMNADTRKVYEQDTGLKWKNDDYENIVRWVVGLFNNNNTTGGRLMNTKQYMPIWNNPSSSIRNLSDAFEKMFERSNQGYEERGRYAQAFYDNARQTASYKQGGSIEKSKTITINDKEYIAYLAETESEREEGLSEVSEMDPNECMTFIFPESIYAQDCIFTCADMSFDIDIAFVDEEDTIVSVVLGEAGDKEPIIPNCDPSTKIAYVIELNANSGVKVGDEVDLDNEDVSNDEVEELYILGPDGQPQGVIQTNSRIFSRIHTRQLIKKAKKANKTKSDSDYKKLGKLVFDIMHKHSTQEPEYVDSPSGD